MLSMKLNFALFFFFILSALVLQPTFAQKKALTKDKTGIKDLVNKIPGRFSGDLQMNTKFYERDSSRAAFNNPFYDDQFFGTDVWFTLNYNIAGFDFGLRYDAYLNSALFDPNVPVTEQGIGRWHISKSIDKLNITVGHFYDQYGIGSTFRAYEARALGIDQAIMGINVGYEFTDHWRVKAFVGRQKNRFKLYKPLIKGMSVEGYVQAGKEKKVSFSPGFSVVNRTLDRETMDGIAAEINGYAIENRFEPKYNTFLGSVFNTLNAGKFSWYLELAGKTEDVLRNQVDSLINPQNGYIAYSTLTFSQKGFGLVLQGKYTKNYDFRVSPNTRLNYGVINYLPSLTRQNTYRLASRYNAAIQPLGELAFQGDLTYSIKKGRTFSLNYSDIRDLDYHPLFKEIYLDFELRLPKKPWKMTTGLQLVDYNRFQFEQKRNYLITTSGGELEGEGSNFVTTLTPFMEFVYKFDRKKSLRIELQYMFTERGRKIFDMMRKEEREFANVAQAYTRIENEPDVEHELQDLGDWAWALAEFNIAPRYSFAVGSMYNFDKKLLYPTILAAVTHKVTRFSINYTKQPDGVVCTGGVCRYEPAFSGLKFDLTTSF